MNPLRPLALALMVTIGGASSAADLHPEPRKDPVIASQLASSWEVLWHQSGMPTRVARWNQPIRMKITGRTGERAHIKAALTEVAALAGVELTQDSANPNLTVEVVPDMALEDREPCVTNMQIDTDTYEIEQIVIQMRQNTVTQCAHHEAMHAMGLRGHPSGETTLSYFTPVRDRLLPLDRVMLRAWYSKAMKPGMTPLEAMPVLADEVVCSALDPLNARLLRDSFMDMVLSDMRRYVAGEGDMPSIIKKSGKVTELGIKKGRTLMAAYLDTSSQPVKSFSQLQCKSMVTYSSDGLDKGDSR